MFRGSRQYVVAPLAALLFAQLLLVPVRTNAADCPVSGLVKIETDEQRRAATAAGIPTDQPCWDPSDPSIGMDAGKAKQYLNSLPKRCTTVGPGCQAPPDAAHINRLNDTFAVCAAKFFQGYTKQYGQVIMSSAFRCGPRTPAGTGCDTGENERAGGAENSNHQIGISIDVNPGGGNSSYQTLWTFASNNPGYGVCFPHQDGGVNTTGYKDNPHMVLAGSGGNEAAACAKQGVTKPCDGRSFTPQPASNISPQQQQQRIQQTTTALANTLRNMFAPPPPPVIPPQPAYSYPTYDPTQYFTPPPPVSPVTIPTTSPPSYNPPPSPVSNWFDDSKTNSTTTNATSSIMLISAISNPTALDVGTKPRPVGTTTVVISSKPQTTFISDDLKNAPINPNEFKNRNILIAVLETMKQILLKVKDMIHPFGHPIPRATALR